ncbi:MAG: Uma2 family endonuclease [Anaerolineales bacterium]|nr:MAG: Uma2 family endonuclease [Anaerolineales bacterium]
MVGIRQEQTVGVEKAISPPKERISYEEFLEWCDEDTWAEWVDGKVVMVSPAATKHQLITGLLLQIMNIYAETRNLGQVLSAPFLMHLPDVPSGREPDLLFVAHAHLDRLKETYLDGPADLVVEIVSPESRARDRGEKFYEYEAAGVGEYWLIDPDRQQAEFYRLSADGRYRLFTADAEGIYHSEVLPGLWLRVEWLWQETLPKVLDVLREMELI